MKVISAFFLCVTLFISPSCYQDVGITIVLLYDLSDSTDKSNNKGEKTLLENMRSEYIKVTAEEVLPRLKGNTKIYGHYITDNPYRDINFKFKLELPASNGIFDNPYVYDEKLDKEKSRLIGTKNVDGKEIPTGEVNKLLSVDNVVNDTCIIQTLSLAQKAFESSTNKNKELWIFSDMIEDCGGKLEKGGIEFDRDAGLPKDPEKFIAEKLQNKIPNLKGVKVFIVGATGGERKNDSPERYRIIEEFWLLFIEKAGVEKKDVQYGFIE